MTAPSVSGTVCLDFLQISRMAFGMCVGATNSGESGLTNDASGTASLAIAVSWSQE